VDFLKHASDDVTLINLDNQKTVLFHCYVISKLTNEFILVTVTTP
jgi:hypothetical protein